MKVILTAQIANLGQIGDLVEVRNGFAKNFLIPNQKAIAFTPNSQKLFEAKKAEFEKIDQERLIVAKKIKDKMLGQNIVIVENASDDGRLYGSVNALVVSDKINEMYGEKVVDKASVVLANPIKDLGVYIVKVELHPEAVLEVKLVVTRLESEAEGLLKAYDKAKKDAADAEKKELEKPKKEKKVALAEGEVAAEGEAVAEAGEEAAEEKK